MVLLIIYLHGEIKTPFDDGSVSVVVLGDSHTEGPGDI